MRAALLALALLPASAAAAPKAPDFSVAKLLGAPRGSVSLADLRGKVVFLEFWATWCGPCVAGIPRTNRLIEKLQGTDAVFLFVTDETEETIRPFLAKREVKAWVGLDEKHRAFGPYKVVGRPCGFLIDRDGTLLASVFPDALQEKDVRDALAGTFAPRPVDWGEERVLAPRAKDGPAPLFELSILPRTEGKRRGMSGGIGKLDTYGLSFAHTLAWLRDLSEEQVILDTAPAAGFDLRLRVPPGQDVFASRGLAVGALERAFGVKVLDETRDMDVYLLALSTAPGAPRPPSAAPEEKSGVMSSGPGRLLGSAPMPEFAKSMRHAADRIVVDDTGLAGTYSLDLEWDGKDPAAQAAALASVGLRLIPGRRVLPVLRVVAAP